VSNVVDAIHWYGLTWSAQIAKNLGSLVRGITPLDIQAFVLDSELLNILEVMGKYEDDLDASQV